MTQKNDANRPTTKQKSPKESTPDSPKQIALYVLFRWYWHICFFWLHPTRPLLPRCAPLAALFLPTPFYCGIADLEGISIRR